MDKEQKEMMETPGFGWRVSLSIIVSIGWIVFLILWLFFSAEGYTMYQNIAIVLVSILVVGAVLGAAWAPWGMKYGHKYNGKRKSGKKKR